MMARKFLCVHFIYRKPLVSRMRSYLIEFSFIFRDQMPRYEVEQGGGVGS